MKKVLLCSVAFFSMLSTYAQNNIETLPEGYHPEVHYAKDFFTDAVEPSNSPLPGGVYWWTQALSGPKLDTTFTLVKTGKTFKCVQDTSSFKYTKDRPGDGTLNYVLQQPYGKYEPVGVGFGFTYNSDHTDSTANVLDLSGGNAFVYVNFENTGTTDDYTLKVLLQDVNGKTLNSVGANTGGNTYLDEILVPVALTATIDSIFTFTATKPKAVAYYADYTLDSCGSGISNVHDVSFDYTHVVAVMFTVVNNHQVASDGFKPSALVDASFTIHKFFVGDINAPVGLADNFLAKPSFKVYPNPVSSNNGIVNFEMEVKDVKVINGFGQVVYSTPSASSLNVNDYQKGMYVIQSSRGASRFIVQ